MPLPANENRLPWPLRRPGNPCVEPLVFFRSLLRNPLKIGALAPSSPKLARLMASRVSATDAAVLEIGGGTGSVTRALLDTGLSPDRLLVIERDPGLAQFLRREFPAVRVRCGDAMHAGRILAAEAMGPVRSVVSSLPLRNMPEPAQVETVQAMLSVLTDYGQLIQFTYAAGCPVACDRLRVRAECLGRVWANLPPAAVWRFTAQHS